MLHQTGFHIESQYVESAGLGLWSSWHKSPLCYETHFLIVNFFMPVTPSPSQPILSHRISRRIKWGEHSFPPLMFKLSPSLFFRPKLWAIVLAAQAIWMFKSLARASTGVPVMAAKKILQSCQETHQPLRPDHPNWSPASGEGKSFWKPQSQQKMI